MRLSSALNGFNFVFRRYARLGMGAALLILIEPSSANEAVSQPSPTFSNPPLIHRPAGYSHVVEVPAGLRTVYVAGQLGLDVHGKLVGESGDFKAQAHQAFENIKIALASAGADFDDVIKMNMYLTDISHQLPELREVRDAYVNIHNAPASTTVEVSRLALPGALFEIEVVAVLPAQ